MMQMKHWVELQYVHPLLAATVLSAAADYRAEYGMDFRVTDGYRTVEEQQRMKAAGKALVTSSQHQTGLAVDLAICNLDGSECTWDFRAYQFADMLMQHAFRRLNPIPNAKLLWGGKWKSLRDGVHWELANVESTYPLPVPLKLPSRPIGQVPPA